MAWTPASQPASSWTTDEFAERVFDPFVFDRAPIFDTGTPSGIWDGKSQPANAWTPE